MRIKEIESKTQLEVVWEISNAITAIERIQEEHNQRITALAWALERHMEGHIKNPISDPTPPELTPPHPSKTLITDGDRIEFLEKLLAEKHYTGKVSLRWSSVGHGFRLHETSNPSAFNSVRDAIDNAIRYGMK